MRSMLPAGRRPSPSPERARRGPEDWRAGRERPRCLLPFGRPTFGLWGRSRPARQRPASARGGRERPENPGHRVANERITPRSRGRPSRGPFSRSTAASYKGSSLRSDLACPRGSRVIPYTRRPEREALTTPWPSVGPGSYAMAESGRRSLKPSVAPVQRAPQQAVEGVFEVLNERRLPIDSVELRVVLGCGIEANAGEVQTRILEVHQEPASPLARSGPMKTTASSCGMWPSLSKP